MWTSRTRTLLVPWACAWAIATPPVARADAPPAEKAGAPPPGPAAPASAGTPPAAATNAAVERLTLDEAIGKSLAISEDVRAGHVRTIEATAQVAKARAALYPALSATGAYTRRSGAVTREINMQQVTVQSANALGATVTVSADLFDPSAWPLVASARHARDAAALDERDRRRLTGFAAASAFLVALGGERIVEAATERHDLALARQREVTARVAAQLTGRNDQTQADLELATAARALTAATMGRDTAYAQLAYWIGEPVTGPLAEPVDIFARATAAAAEPDAVDPAAVDARPDVAAARLRVDAATEAAKAPGRRGWPVLGAFGQLRFTNEPGLSGRSADWSVGVTATWSIWDGGARDADRRVAAGESTLAALAATSTERLARTEVATARVAVRGAAADLAAATAAAGLASRNVDEVAVLYGQGLVRAFELTDAASRRFDAEVARVEATIALAAAYLELLAAVGTDPGALGAER